jgi:hypothetical protein
LFGYSGDNRNWPQIYADERGSEKAIPVLLISVNQRQSAAKAGAVLTSERRLWYLYFPFLPITLWYGFSLYEK